MRWGFLLVMAVWVILHTPSNVQAANPFLPVWERIPDGEPRIFPEPETGEERIYLYGSHDSSPRDHVYCGREYVVWSACASGFNEWRHEGTVFDIENLDGVSYFKNGREKTLKIKNNHVLYAPDVVYNPVTEKYYMYLFLAGASPANMIFVASGDSPAGPFTKPVYVCDGFDPAVLVDEQEDGSVRVYLYFSSEANRELFACELDPGDMHTMVEDSLHYPASYEKRYPGKSTMISQSMEPFYFFEGPSIRKVKGVYILSYARSEPVSGDKNGRLSEIGWAWSDNPFGNPREGRGWTYGGVIISNKGEIITDPYDSGRTTYTYIGNNNHGGMFEVNGQWYQIYHRDTNVNYKRQAMAEPILFYFQEDGTPVIRQAEMTSQGFETEGLNPYEPLYAASTCYTLPQTYSGFLFWKKSEAPQIITNPDCNFDPKADHGDWYPVTNLKNHSWLGYKYYDFGEGAEGKMLLSLELLEKHPGRINIYASDAKEDFEEPEKEKILIGTAELSGENTSVHKVEAEVDAALLTGRKGIYLEFLSESTEEICEINKLQFLRYNGVR